LVDLGGAYCASNDRAKEIRALERARAIVEKAGDLSSIALFQVLAPLEAAYAAAGREAEAAACEARSREPLSGSLRTGLP